MKKSSCNWMQICGVCYSFDILHNLFYIQMRSYFNIFYCSAISYCVRYIHTNKNDFAFAKLKMTSYYKRSHKLADIICFKRLGVIFFCIFLLIWIPHLNCGVQQFSCKLCRPKQRKTIKNYVQFQSRSSSWNSRSNYPSTSNV